VVNGVSFFEPPIESLVRWGADFGPLTARGEWWRIITAAFVHIGIIHIAMNMYILWGIGTLTERLFGNLRFGILYLLAGIGGNLLSVALHPFTVAAGASGAVFGVYGGLFGFLLMEHSGVPRRSVKTLSTNAAVFLGYNIFYAFSQEHIDIAAHIGGFVTGFLAGCALAQPLVPSINRAGLKRSLLVGLAGIGLAALCIRGLPAGTESQAEWYRQTFTAPSVIVGTKDRIVYSGAPKEKAEALGQVLKTVGFLQDRGVEVSLSKRADATIVSFPLKDGFWEEQANVDAFEEIGRQIAPAIGGVPIKLHLLSSDGDLKKELVITTRELRVGTRDKILYSGSATEEDAKSLGLALQRTKFFTDAGSVVHLSKGSDGAVVSVQLKKGAWDNPQIMASIPAFGRAIAPAVGGLPMKVREIDQSGHETKREIRVEQAGQSAVN
jgi:rhomboid protease GluP